MSNETHLFERLLQKITPGCKLLRVWPLKGGISAEMTALEIETAQGQTKRLIVRRPAAAADKRNPQGLNDEFKLLQYLHSLRLPAPEPYHLEAAGEIFATPSLVVAYIEGAVAFAPANIDRYILQFAAHLAEIHQVDGALPRLSLLPKKANRCAEIDHQQPVNAEPLFEEVRIRAAFESIGPRSERNAPVLLHGDYWPGNVLWQAEQLVAVIDWEDACIGDPLIDLAVSRLDLLTIFGWDAMRSFTRHYQSARRIDLFDLPYWDLCASLRFVRMVGADLDEWAGFFHPFGRRDITRHTLMENYQLFIAQAFEKLTA